MAELNTIVADVARAVADRRAVRDVEQLKEQCRNAPPIRDFVAALRRLDEGAISVVAELKRSSPRRGFIADIPDPLAVARECEQGGAAALSVVVEPKYFHGTLTDLTRVKNAVDIPVAAKDIIVSPYQILEARSAGADMVVLMANVLQAPILALLADRAHSLGMAVMVEVQSRFQALAAISAGADIVGINACDVTDSALNLDNFAQIVDVIPETVITLAQSGINTDRDVFNLAAQGADAILSGYAVMTAANRRQRVADLVAVGSHPALERSRRQRLGASVKRIASDA